MKRGLETHRPSASPPPQLKPEPKLAAALDRLGNGVRAGNGGLTAGRVT
jgi:hypothetical protein